jgi:hypothetical protein
MRWIFFNLPNTSSRTVALGLTQPLTGMSTRKHFLIGIVGGGLQLCPIGTAATNRPIVPNPGWLWWWRNWWNDNWQGKLKYSEKTCPRATLSSTNPTWSARKRTRAAAVGSQWLIASAMARPTMNLPGGNGGRRIRLRTLPPPGSRLSRLNVGASTSHNPMAFTASYWDSLTLEIKNMKIALKIWNRNSRRGRKDL